MKMPIIIEGRKVWLRGNLGKKYKTLKQLETAKEKEAIRWEKGLDFMGRVRKEQINPRMAKAIRNKRILTWLNENGAIFRTEKVKK